jgi:4-hydroxyphenylpyruvate dioxygenase
MEFNHLSFYVNAVAPWRDWFINAWGGVWAGGGAADEPDLEVRRWSMWGRYRLLLVSAPAVVGSYLQQHPPGIGDIALRVVDLERP